MLRKIRIGINGFGRIGRAAFKIASKKPNIEVVAINDIMDPETATYLLKHDSIYDVYDEKVEHDEKNLIINRKKIPVLNEKDPSQLPWKRLEVDVVLECSGRFTKGDASYAHLQAGAKKTIVSAPVKGGSIETFLLGVNAHLYKKQKIISNASCTTNCVAPAVKILQENFGVEKGMITTVHAYTAEQNLVDSPSPPLHKDLRRGRAAAINLVPTSTGSATDTIKTVKGLEGRFDGVAIRAPVAVGSISDFTVLLKRKVTVEEINLAFLEYSKKFPAIMEVTNEPLVSSDIIGNTHSAIIDLSLTKVVGGDLVKVFAWYDNEWGYANRLVEEVEMVMR